MQYDNLEALKSKPFFRFYLFHVLLFHRSQTMPGQKAKKKDQSPQKDGGL